MKFNAELISFKLMNSSGTLRIALDVPEVAVPAVMGVIANYLKEPLLVDISIDQGMTNNKPVEDKITGLQITYIHTLFSDISKKYGQSVEVIKSSCKRKFLGNETISTKDLSKQQAEIFIDKLKELNEVNTNELNTRSV
jgi:hypothetical protein